LAGELLDELLAALHGSAPAAALRASPWLYPAVETVHILGLALLVGAVAVFDLRALGAVPALSRDTLGRLALPLAAGGLAAASVSGAALFAADAVELAGNPAFLWKMGLFALALANVALWHRWAAKHPGRARLGAAASLLLWVSVLVAGRLIAYI